MVAAHPNGPVADFCTALRDLQVASGMSRSALAREIHYGRSQLYDILDGRIRRPPEWDRLVEPLVRACLRGRTSSRWSPSGAPGTRCCCGCTTS